MDRDEIDAIMRKARVCRLGWCDEGKPYVVPVCFGYDGRALYFHSSPRGRKMNVLRRSPDVCFEVDVDVELVPADEACRWGVRYRSVIGFGRAVPIDDPQEKRKALDILMRQYAEGEFAFSEDGLARAAVVRIEVDSITGKSSGY